jgi:hypothetical protein
MRGLLCSVVLAAGALPSALLGSGPAASSNAPLIPAHPGQPLSRAGGTIQSLNWSGYVDTAAKKNITGVLSRFTVPGVLSPPRGFASTWDGIGGYNNTHLIQAGVSEFAAPNGSYYAWYEMLPAASKPIHNCTGDSACTVAPGDRLTVQINRVGPNQWKFTMKDRRLWSWTKTVSYSASRDSAEWILESPTVNGSQKTLPHVNTAYFGPTSTFVKGGKSETINQGNPVKLLMVTRKGKREATPSALTGSEQFNDCSWVSTCAAP